ncbi:unnamed protein product (macronuclear) [Paramecium tetraurelia]|uniref:FYVE-type domain-containing protein n=1 Tax=Paramecium tetraurelia TaxID=5888 RepID=A0DEW2_PARTE|nr:uncharacterized protein GSPATT00016405001 [Paramecium tetraurelia]CAK81579.1 unnamed protein product [Paramecium tetraurelia]|eukprot:XP_001448976.1 hypothetical protein (macronuclear) [Paramecium tetraurelia strain d4-2]
MLSEQIVNPEPGIATEFENKLVCHICDDELERPNHCDFCGKSTCSNCIVKRRKSKDDAFHPVCEYCERLFLERILILSAKKQKDDLANSLDQANTELANKRQQLYSFKNVFHNNPESTTSEQKIQKLDEDIIEATYQKNLLLSQLQEIESEKIQIKQSNIEKAQSVDIKQVKLQETTNKAQKSKDELEDIQRQIDEFLANLPNLEAEQKSAITQLDFSNYEQIFRGSNLPELMNQQAIKQSQIMQQPSSKKKKEDNKECNIY